MYTVYTWYIVLSTNPIRLFQPIRAVWSISGIQLERILSLLCCDACLFYLVEENTYQWVQHETAGSTARTVFWPNATDKYTTDIENRRPDSIPLNLQTSLRRNHISISQQPCLLLYAMKWMPYSSLARGSFLTAPEQRWINRRSGWLGESARIRWWGLWMGNYGLAWKMRSFIHTRTVLVFDRKMLPVHLSEFYYVLYYSSLYCLDPKGFWK